VFYNLLQNIIISPKEREKLVTHPLIESFINFKWSRIKRIIQIQVYLPLIKSFINFKWCRIKKEAHSVAGILYLPIIKSFVNFKWFRIKRIIQIQVYLPLIKSFINFKWWHVKRIIQIQILYFYPSLSYSST
jgi:hypothetical protein